MDPNLIFWPVISLAAAGFGLFVWLRQQQAKKMVPTSAEFNNREL